MYERAYMRFLIVSILDLCTLTCFKIYFVTCTILLIKSIIKLMIYTLMEGAGQGDARQHGNSCFHVVLHPPGLRLPSMCILHAD